MNDGKIFIDKMRRKSCFDFYDIKGYLSDMRTALLENSFDLSGGEKIVELDRAFKILDDTSKKFERMQALWDIAQLEDAIKFEQDVLEKEQQKFKQKIDSYKERIDILRATVLREE